MKIIEGGITSPKGFIATGDHIGIKKHKKDLCLIASEVPCVAAGMFTKNIVKAAPVTWDQERVNNKKGIKGIIVNSGNANACTGQQGMDDCAEMASCYAELLSCEPDQVLVCSTGVIGLMLPMDVIKKGVKQVFPSLGKGDEHDLHAMEAILTTDTFKKTATVEIELSGGTVRIAGIAKGSGMIHPNMATMLAFITTDALITGDMLNKALRDTVEDSFNMISVDRDTSTNDTVLILASGLASKVAIDSESKDFEIFKDALGYITKTLAKDVARDGEGASKLMEVTVKGAKTVEDARTISRSVVSSNLFKAALFGEDATWGRVLCSMGYSGGEFDPNTVTLSFRSIAGEILLLDNGVPIVFDEDLASTILKEKEIFIDIQLSDGDAIATAWGCDLTYDYVKINGDYRS